jgi:hypothetical protein
MNEKKLFCYLKNHGVVLHDVIEETEHHWTVRALLTGEAGGRCLSQRVEKPLPTLFHADSREAVAAYIKHVERELEADRKTVREKEKNIEKAKAYLFNI